MPPESLYWPGGRLQQDHGVVIYDVNHLKVRIPKSHITICFFPALLIK